MRTPVYEMGSPYPVGFLAEYSSGSSYPIYNDPPVVPAPVDSWDCHYCGRMQIGGVSCEQCGGERRRALSFPGSSYPRIIYESNPVEEFAPVAIAPTRVPWYRKMLGAGSGAMR